jgi:hypothetical protein
MDSELAGCGKIKYFSCSDAQYAKWLLKYEKGHTAIARHYQCEECGKLGMGEVWHLTKKKNGSRKKK